MLPAISVLLAMANRTVSASELAGWGNETLRTIQKEFAMPGSSLYAEAVGEPKREVAFNWSAGVMLSALNAASRWDPAWKSTLRSYADAAHCYWNTAPPVAGFDVLPNASRVDRFYDDNAWMVMAYVETFELLRDRKYLDWAKDALSFSLSGEDDKLGGGIYWRENEKTSKNTCSNAPVAAGCLAVYEHDREPKYLAKAEELYAWTKKNLQDPADSLYWDSIRVSDAHVDRTKWSYNTALMIRAATDLFKLTGRQEYRDDERAMHKSSRDHWLRPDGALADDGPFAHLLLEAWIRADREDPRSEEAKRDEQQGTKTSPIAYIRLHCQRDGLYGKRWERPLPEGQSRYQLIDQAAAARGFFEGALAERR